MADKDVLIAMLTRAGIKYGPAVAPKPGNGWDWPEGASGITVEDGGYFGFFSEFVFNEDGSLNSVNAWE